MEIPKALRAGAPVKRRARLLLVTSSATCGMSGHESGALDCGGLIV
jgi:hypothetical protein